MNIGNRFFDIGKRTYIMGILNITPDSFSDGGRFSKLDTALKRAERMVNEGADIIDIGAESTRPGYIPISVSEEIDRLIPILQAIKERIDIPVSVDTYKGEVAEAAIGAGADLINDIYGLKYDENISKIIGKADIPCCIMHNRANKDYEDFEREFKKDIQESLVIAEKSGIKWDKIILDPGIGFAKNTQQNLEVIRNPEYISQFGLPILLGTSRKSFIGNILNLPVEERLEGTLATTMIAVQQGYSFVRVHDVKENKRVIQMCESI